MWRLIVAVVAYAGCGLIGDLSDMYRQIGYFVAFREVVAYADEMW